jgi:ribosomal protein L11 methyltransferase
MLWFEITATAPPGDVDGVAAILRDVAPGGVTIEEPVDLLGPEMGFRVRGGEPVLVRGYLPSSELGAVLVDQLRSAMTRAFPHVEVVAKPLYEQDWAVSWREFFGVVDYGGRVVIVPSWVEHELQPGQVAVRLDPGQAFGTGHHETTRLCLAALEEWVRPGDRVLDVGTGSGVLAIAAVLLGAAAVHAIDIDPVAVEIAAVNCEANGVRDRVTLAAGTLEPGSLAPHPLVVANISPQANIGLAPAFATAVSPGGRLLISGVLGADLPRVREALAVHGFALTAVRTERDWALGEFLRVG